MHQGGPAPGLLFYPAGHRLVATTGADDQVGPGRLQDARCTPVDARQGRAAAQVDQQLPGARPDMLFLVAAAQLVGERPHLGVVTGFPAQQTPDCDRLIYLQNIAKPCRLSATAPAVNYHTNTPREARV